MDYLFTAFKRYAEFSGRSRRLEFGMFQVLVIVVSVVLAFLEADSGIDDPNFGSGPLSIIFTLAILIPAIALGVRRLHDFNASGWWYLLVLIPVVNIVLMLVLLFKRGTEGINRFGPDPKQV